MDSLYGNWKSLFPNFFESSIAKKEIDYYEQSLKISREIGDISTEGVCLGNLGLAYRNLGEPKKAIEYYDQALKIAKEIENPRIIDFCERNLDELKNSKR